MRRTTPSMLLAAAFAAASNAQQLDLPVLPGVPGEVDSEFSQLICYDWELGQPVTFSCPPTSAPQAQAIEGCIRVTVDQLPATQVTLRGFEATFAPTPTQTATFFGQGSISHTVGESVIRMVPGSGPFVGTFDPKANAFLVTGVPIEAEGLVAITGTGMAGMAFPLAVLDLADFVFPPADVFVATVEVPMTGEDAVILSGILGAPVLKPGGRLDVGSGFVVGLGGGVLLNSLADGGTCGGDACPADVNGDGEATSADFFAWVVAFGNMDPECDVNNDSLCTSADFFAWVAAFGQGC